MRIGTRIFIVGAIPIAIAAGIALAAILLLQEANVARDGAAMAGTVFRTLLTAVMARNEYVHATPNMRFVPERRFYALTSQAKQDLADLRKIALGPNQATLDAESTLAQYVRDMEKLATVTGDNDRMIEGMEQRASALIRLTDQARARQHGSNADIVNSLNDGDTKLRHAREIMDAAFAARLATASVQMDLLRQASPGATDAGQVARNVSFDGLRLKRAVDELVRKIAVQKDGRFESAQGINAALVERLDRFLAAEQAGPAAPLPEDQSLMPDLIAGTEQVLKVYSAEYRAYHEEAAQLLTYSVQAHDTELATQNIAIETLKLSNLSSAALARRDESSARSLATSSRGLSEAIAALPISPLIQSDMIEAFAQWRDDLQATTTHVKQQNDLMNDMDQASAAMIQAARSLDATFSANAESTARSIRTILLTGAATGLLLGGAAALFVARSITRPLVDLQSRMVRMARDQNSGLIDDHGRRDELGDIARATNVFLVEIARRERALRSAKERADAALHTLRQTQAELIQAEKLASLGQLVAGIAHEINTPIGIALTTSTVVDEEARRFRTAVADGRVSRGALDRMVERVSEGADLLTANLARAAELIQSFKHVAADQVSGERREFKVKEFLHDLLTSLGPMLRKAGHSATMDCPDHLQIDSHPGALAQVITNLVVNASLHGFQQGQPGLITVSVTTPDADLLRIEVNDHGRGIPADVRGKIFDPFFTTRRSHGSTGLGLHIVFNLVTSTLGGRIELDSVSECGTTFVVDLPRNLKAVRKHDRQHEAVS